VPTEKPEEAILEAWAAIGFVSLHEFTI